MLYTGLIPVFFEQNLGNASIPAEIQTAHPDGSIFTNTWVIYMKNGRNDIFYINMAYDLERLSIQAV